MIKIKIEKTPRGGYHAIKEHASGDHRSLIVVNSAGKRKKAAGKNNLIRIAINDIAIVCFHYNNQFIINIYKILDIDADQGYMYVDKLNNYEAGIWYDTLPEHLAAAVDTAKRLATGGVEK